MNQYQTPMINTSTSSSDEKSENPERPIYRDILYLKRKLVQELQSLSWEIELTLKFQTLPKIVSTTVKRKEIISSMVLNLGEEEGEAIFSLFKKLSALELALEKSGNNILELGADIINQSNDIIWKFNQDVSGVRRLSFSGAKRDRESPEPSMTMPETNEWNSIATLEPIGLMDIADNPWSSSTTSEDTNSSLLTCLSCSIDTPCWCQLKEGL